MSTILVTGGAGYVGSHVCKRMASAGHGVICYDDCSMGHAEFVKWGPFERGDIRDCSRLSEVVSRHRPDAVIHLAARSLVGDCERDPAGCYSVNVGGALALLETMRTHDVNMLVFSSTCAVFGIPETRSLHENLPKQPINTYGRSKLMVEGMLQDYERAHGVRSIALRYFNAAGADPDGEIGEWHDPETHLIPIAIEAALGRRAPLKLFGTDYDTADGTAIRDYVHVSDLADAHLTAFEHLAGGASGGAYNLGTGQGTSVRDIINAVGKVSGLSVPVEEAPRRIGDPPVLVADPALANRALKWHPAYTDIDSIIATAVRWHQANPLQRR